MVKNIPIGLKIKASREAKELSQIEVVEKLAEKDIDMSRETLSKIENGNRTISAVELNAICKILNIDLNDLFEEDKDDDLVTLFRKKHFSENNWRSGKTSGYDKDVYLSKKIYNGEFKPQERKPLWKEC